jgi:nitrous oxidase accessory protein NosD
MAVLNVPAQFPTIQAAVNAASPGDTILIAPGVYHESVTIPAGKDRLRIEGAGSTQTILDGANTFEFGIVSSDSPLVTVRSLGVRHFTREGIRSAAFGNRWSDLLLLRNGTQGIQVFAPAIQNVIESVIARCNGGDGISVFDETYIVKSQAIQNRRHGIVASGAHNLLLANRAELNGNRGIAIAGRQNQVLNNEVQCNGTACGAGGGILALGGAHLLFGNEAVENNGCGIELLITDRVRVHQNLAARNLRGICVGGGTRNSLTLNQVRGNSFDGIRVIGGSTQNLTGENQVRGNGGPGIAHGLSAAMNAIRRNTALQNRPDLLDQTGTTTNVYAANVCQTAIPGGLCNPGLNVLRVPAQFPTIQAAVNAASPGQVILVDPGVYNEAVTIPAGRDRILIQGAGPGSSILDGQNLLGTGFTVVAASMVTIRGFTIRNYTANGVFIQNESNWLDHLELTAILGAAVRLFSARHNLITNLDLHDLPGLGIEVAELSVGNWVVGNRVRVVLIGIIVNQLAERNLIWQNDVRFATETAYRILGASNYVVENLASFAPRIGIAVTGAPGNLFLGNIVVGADGQGINVMASPRTFLLQNTTNQNQDDGIRTNNSGLALIVGNSVQRNEEDGIAIQSPNGNVVGDENSALNNDDSGLRVQAAPGNSFRRNVLCNNSPDLLADVGNEYDLNTCDLSVPAGLCQFGC